MTRSAAALTLLLAVALVHQGFSAPMVRRSFALVKEDSEA